MNNPKKKLWQLQQSNKYLPKEVERGKQQRLRLTLNKTVAKKTATRRRKLKAVTVTIVKMEKKKPMARNRPLVAEDVAVEDVVAADAPVMEKLRR